MKILQIIPNLGVGGAENMMCNLSCELIKDQHEVVVVVFYEMSSFIYEKLKKMGIKIISINKKKGFNLKTLIDLRNIIKDEKPNIIHTHLYTLPYVWLISGKIKIIHTLHTVAAKEQSGIGKKICGLIYKYSKKCIPVAISNLVKKSFDEEYKFNFNMPIIENGIPIDDIKKKKTYDLNEEINIFHVGSIIPVKNHNLMINAMEYLSSHNKQVKLHFFGSGYLQKKIQEGLKGKKIQNKIIFEGLKPNINKELYKGDIFLLPSEYEGIPLSLLEAMAAGLPCIASKVGGIPDIIDNSVDGLLIEPTVDDITKTIEKVINNKNLREEIGKNAIVKAKKFSSYIMAKRYIEVYTNDFKKKIDS